MYEKKTERWLCSANPETYDFREEIVTFDPEAGKSSIDRFFIYKALGIVEECSPGDLGYEEAEKCVSSGVISVEVKGGEADKCEMVLDIFKSLWSDEYLSCCAPTGDTMNSANYTLCELLKPFVVQSGMDHNCKNARWGNKKVFSLYYYNQERIKQLMAPFEAFWKHAYSIGNFMPVPPGLNSSRGFGNAKIMDYWDLTLWYLYQWYLVHSKQQIGQEADAFLFAVVKTEKNVALCKKWLDAFGSWDRFVTANYLQDFVRKADPATDPGIFGCPEELWEGHFTGNVLPTESQTHAFFKNAGDRILARSGRMVNALRKTKGVKSLM